MKHLFDSVSILVLGILLTISSCKKEETLTLDNPSKPTEREFNYGELHNGAVSYFYENKGSLKISSYEEEAIDHIISYLIFEDWVTTYDEDSIKEFIRDNNYFGVIASNPPLSDSQSDSMFNSAIDTAHARLTFTSGFLNDLRTVVELTLSNPNDPEVVLDYVKSEIEDVYNSTSDSLAAAVFVDVYNHSYLYWEENFVPRYSNEKMLKKSSYVIGADAVGALHGLIFGPVGSIIEGAFWSIAYNEGWF